MSANAPTQDQLLRSPEVSVVLTTYNRAGLLRETVNSILNQTYSDFELIIVDNMSSDETEDYVASVTDERIRYFRNPNHGIIAHNRNFGIKRARGNYLAFCDDDDLWLPEKIQKQFDVMNQNPQVGICFSNADAFYPDGKVVHSMVRGNPHASNFVRLLRGNMIPNSSAFVRRKLFDECGLIDESPLLKGVEDYEMWLRIAFHNQIYYSGESLIKYRLHATNASVCRSELALKDLTVLRSIERKIPISKYLLIYAMIYRYLSHYYYLMRNV